MLLLTRETGAENRGLHTIMNQTFSSWSKVQADDVFNVNIDGSVPNAGHTCVIHTSFDAVVVEDGF